MSGRIQITVPAYAFTVDKSALRKALRAAGVEVASVARALIRKSQSGAPGQPPVNRTGNLASHMSVKVFKSGGGVSIEDTAESKRGSHAPYALFLEFGAVGGIASGKAGVKGKRNKRRRINGKSVLISVVGSRVLPPHPFLTTALEQRESSIAERVQAAVIDGIKFQRIKP